MSITFSTVLFRNNKHGQYWLVCYHSQYYHEVNKINFYGMIAIAFFVTMARLHERNCPLVDRAVASNCTAVFVFAQNLFRRL